MDVARGQIDGDNLPRFLVHPQMKLSPGTPAPTAHAMLANIPFTYTENLQPRAIDDHVPYLIRRCDLPSCIESTLAPAHRRVVRYR